MTKRFGKNHVEFSLSGERKPKRAGRESGNGVSDEMKVNEMNEIVFYLYLFILLVKYYLLNID